MKRTFLPAAGTAALAGTVLVRIVRIVKSWQSVRRFYHPGGEGPLWFIVELLLFLGPFLTALSAIALLWLRREAGRLGTVNSCAAGFFTLAEGLTVLARSMNGHSGYVGAEPLFSALACGISIAVVFCSRRAGRQEKQREEF